MNQESCLTPDQRHINGDVATTWSIGIERRGLESAHGVSESFHVIGRHRVFEISR